MIFTGIKRKSNQLFFNKELPKFLKSNQNHSSNGVKKIIVFLDDISEESTIRKGLKEILNVANDDLEVLIFQTKVSKSGNVNGVFTSRDFGWYGKIKSEFLKSVLTNKYDLLINYSKVDNLYSNLLILSSTAVFRVGFAQSDSRFYDLLIDCEKTNIELFNSELKKYLKILNKL